MAEIKLFKNKELILTNNGELIDEVYFFGNITYNPKDNILVREDENFKFFLDFKNSTSEVTIKENDYKLNLKINVIKLETDNNMHNIQYNIESEDVIENQITITF